MKNFTDRLAFITGGSSGIGLETALLLASQGCSLVLMARGQAGLDRARDRVAGKTINGSQKIDTITMDVADNEDVRRKIDLAVEKSGIPDILINSAGVGIGDYFENITFEQFDRVMKINVYGTRNAISAVLPHMKEKGGGHIVNLSSAAGLIGMFGYSVYCTSKYALVGLSECLRSELKRFNIAVTVVCPPEVKTPFLQAEAETLPPEGRAVKSLAGLLEPDYVARTIVAAIRRKKFLVVPGLAAKFLYFQHRHSNGLLTRLPSDLIAALVGRRSKKK